MTAHPVATLTQHWLGLAPYVVIEMRPASDGSGNPSIYLEPGGGAEEQPLALPLLAVTETAAEGNPLAEMLRELWQAPGRPQGWHAALAAFVMQCNPDWRPFVCGDNGVPSTEGTDDEGQDDEQ